MVLNMKKNKTYIMDSECFNKCPVTIPARTEEDEPDLCNSFITNIPIQCKKPCPCAIVKHVESFKDDSVNSLNYVLLVVLSILLVKKYFIKV